MTTGMITNMCVHTYFNTPDSKASHSIFYILAIFLCLYKTKKGYSVYEVSYRFPFLKHDIVVGGGNLFANWAYCHLTEIILLRSGVRSYKDLPLKKIMFSALFNMQQLCKPIVLDLTEIA